MSKSGGQSSYLYNRLCAQRLLSAGWCPVAEGKHRPPFYWIKVPALKQTFSLHLYTHVNKYKTYQTLNSNNPLRSNVRVVPMFGVDWPGVSPVSYKRRRARAGYSLGVHNGAMNPLPALLLSLVGKRIIHILMCRTMDTWKFILCILSIIFYHIQRLFP